jgi:hypothetical protein
MNILNLTPVLILTTILGALGYHWGIILFSHRRANSAERNSIFWDIMLCSPLKLTLHNQCCENLKSYISSVEVTVFSTPNMKPSYSYNSPVYMNKSLVSKEENKIFRFNNLSTKLHYNELG